MAPLPAANTQAIQTATGGTNPFTTQWYNFFAGLASLANSPVMGVSVVAFGADPTGATDSTTSIQNAINSLPATGGNVYFPVGIYKISSAITVGNGTSSTNSTVAGVNLIGLGGTGAPELIDNSFAGSVVLRWAGAVGGGPMVSFVGPLTGWGVQNIVFDGTVVSPATGLQYRSCGYGLCQNLAFGGCSNDSIAGLTWDPFTVTGIADSIHNTFININVAVPNVNFARGIRLDGGLSGAGSVTSDTDYNTFINTTVVLPAGANTTYGLFLKVCDNNNFIDTHLLGGGVNTVGIQFDYTINGNFPAGNKFFGLDNAIATAYLNNGTPNASPLFVNEVFGLMRSNGGPLPNAVANLGYTGSGQIGYNTPGSAIGGTVTQITSITTPVTINKICGQIVTVSNAFTAGTIVQFTVNNNLVAATDVIAASLSTANGIVGVNSVSAGSFVIALDPLVTATSTVTINFAIIKSVNT